MNNRQTEFGSGLALTLTDESAMREIDRRRNRKTTIRLLTVALNLMLALAFPAFSRGQDADKERSGQTQEQEIKVPQTPQEHRERAELNRKKAAERRQEAESHKKMLADYSKRVARNPKDQGENPYIRKMRLHCEKFIRAAETLALESEEMAKYHIMRAKEMEGE